MNNTLPYGGARFAPPEELPLAAEEAQEDFGHCEECGEPLLPRHFIGVCDFCADLMPHKERVEIRRKNRAPADSGASKRLVLLGAKRFRDNLWTVPGIPELLSAREALRYFGPDELPAKMR